MNIYRCYCFCLLLLPSWVLAQEKPLPAIRTKTDLIRMQLGTEWGNFNGINAIPTVFSYDFGTESPQTRLTLASEYDTLVVELQQGKTSNFQIIRLAKGDTVTCHFSSHPFVKAAVFTNAYKTKNQGKVLTEIPEVYELVNIVFALTAYGRTDAIYKKTPYYQQVMKAFGPYRSTPAVQKFDTLLRQSADNYFNLKMDSYAFRFAGNSLVNGGIYDRVSWGEENTLRPYLPLLETFAQQTGFRRFFAAHQSYYTSLIRDYQQHINVAAMKVWLEKQFPATHYSAIKVIFSPLVGWNQSANSFSDNGFTEAQAHVNFPFVGPSAQKQSEAFTNGQRMTIVFTELNHSYLNPEAEKYSAQVASAFQNLSKWVTTGTASASYNNPLRCFEEYMNYGLVTLYYADLFDPATFSRLLAELENNMTENRGFRQFRAFNQTLLTLYREKKPGQTVADLYPAILTWAAAQP